MDRSPSSLLLSWLLVPVAAVLVMSALTLPRQPYTGLVLKGVEVVGVDPGSPGERAGLAPGDWLRNPEAGAGQAALVRGPLAGAVPGRPITLERRRGGEWRRVWLVPDPLPDGERHMMGALLAVASGFVLLGGWVWGERRDALTRTFFLLCLAFAWLLAPARPWTHFTPAAIDIFILTVIELFLPALFVHFFALFPESHARGRRDGVVRAGYVVATVLTLPTLFLIVIAALGTEPPPAATTVVHGLAGLWFASGLLLAIGLFIASYLRAGSADARRRLRVALIGTILGAGPLAALIAVRNLSPGTAVPGERWAVVLTLLVPASLAWATAVHRIFDFRVALRAVVVTALVVVASAIAYAFGEWLAAMWWPDLGAGIAGGALAFVALMASLAGPALPWLALLGARVVPTGDDVSLAGWRESEAAPGAGPHRSVETLLAEACEAACRFLRIDGCLALITHEDGVRPVLGLHTRGIREPGPGLRLRAGHLGHGGVQSVEAAPLQDADREALELAGVGWLLPIGNDPVRAVLLLGRRLAGPWLSRREMTELERFAGHLAMSLENEALRREASSHGALERELREAGAIQAHLLPRHAPVYPTLDCAAATLSSEPVGGDYYDFVEGANRDFTLVVGDAAGKGVPAALLLAQVQARFRREASQGALTPGQLLGSLNRELVGLDQPEKFVGLLCARVDVRAGRVWFANGGLTPPLIRRADGRFMEVLTGGVLLGVSAEAFYPDVCVDLRAGDVALVYTDGLTEARRGDELYGVERVRRILDEHARRRAVDILEALLADIRAWTDRPLDDLTVLVLRQLTDPAAVRPEAPQNALKWQSTPADAMG